MKKLFFLLLPLVVLGCGSNQIYGVINGTSTGEDSTGICESSNPNVSCGDFVGINSLTTKDDQEITINWDALANEYQYFVRQKISGTQTLVSTETAGTTSYNFTGLMYDTTYEYKIDAVDTDGNYFMQSEWTTIKTDAQPPNPTSLTFVNFDTNDETPEVEAVVQRLGDSLVVYTDSSCTNQLLETNGYAATTFGFSIPELNSSGTYQFYSRLKNSNGALSDCTASTSPQAITVDLANTCPDGFVPVPAPPEYGDTLNDVITTSFCVMDYEAKGWEDKNSDNLIGADEMFGATYSCPYGCWWSTVWGSVAGDVKAISDYEDSPIIVTGMTAFGICDSLNSEGHGAGADTNNDGTYALISNAEWTVIARNLENVASNWTDGAVGSGCLKQGNIGVVNSCAGGDASFARQVGTLATGNIVDSSTNSLAQLTLDNGYSLWDFSGNVAEHIDLDIATAGYQGFTPGVQPYLFSDGVATDSYLELADIDTNLAELVDPYLPDPAHGHAIVDGIGSYRGRGVCVSNNSANCAAATRGGSVENGLNAGAFAMSIENEASFYGSYNFYWGAAGFRCVFRP